MTCYDEHAHTLPSCLVCASTPLADTSCRRRRAAQQRCESSLETPVLNPPPRVRRLQSPASGAYTKRATDDNESAMSMCMSGDNAPPEKQRERERERDKERPRETQRDKERKDMRQTMCASAWCVLATVLAKGILRTGLGATGHAERKCVARSDQWRRTADVRAFPFRGRAEVARRNHDAPCAHQIMGHTSRWSYLPLPKATGNPR